MCGHSVSRSEPSLCFLSPDTCTCSPLPFSGYRGRSRGSPAVPHHHRYYEALRLLPTHPRPPPVSLGSRYLPAGRRWGALLGSWEIPVEACPELGTPADPRRPCNGGRLGTAFCQGNGVGIRDKTDFGAEPSRPASLLCTLRTHQSPGEWQHSLLACLLDFGQAGISPAGFH